MTSRHSTLATVALTLLFGACSSGTNQAITQSAGSVIAISAAYAAAGEVELPKRDPEAIPGLANLYQLSPMILSGAEPEHHEALEELARRGVRTILSVDGKVPDHEVATSLGMRYVHVPIRYSGISADETLAITKTFRELEGPFYVHCFHGKHRGPAAAALGRIVVDGVDRTTALAEMRQWCGTAEKYEGLYRDVAFDPVPNADECSKHAFDFPSAHAFVGERQAMVEATRHLDVMRALANRQWQPEPKHPDWDARNSAEKLSDVFEQLAVMEELWNDADDYRDHMRRVAADSRRIADLVDAFEGGDASAGERARKLVIGLKRSCTECHADFRNNR